MKNKLFSKATLLLTLLGLTLNIVLVWLTDVLAIPLYLDSIGTVIAAALGGTLPGIAVGLLSNDITALFAVSPDPMTLYYGFLNVLIAVVAARLSKRALLLHWRGRLLAVVAFSLIGGALGSVVTWMLYGFSFGQGISAPLANFFYTSLHMSEFSAQFLADMAIDLIDKSITVAALCAVLELLPKSVLTQLPLGAIYCIKDKQSGFVAEVRKGREAQQENRSYRRHSIRTKVTLLIVVSASILGVIALVIGSAGYRKRLIAQYSSMCKDAVSMMLPKINADQIDAYLMQGEAAPGYTETENDLYDILNNAEKIKYMYVYRILPDGCHVVFDLDSGGLPGEEPGTLVAFDESFPYITQTLAGESIPPVITNDTYGWLLTVYEPIQNTAGHVVAYAAADIDMQQIKTDLYSFCISVLSLLFGAIVLITAFSLWYCDRKLLEPMSALVEQARSVNFDESGDGDGVRERRIVQTGDELEEIFRAMRRTEDAMAEYIARLKEKNLEISHMQRNIIYTLANMVENRDESTGGHIRRTAGYVKLIAQKLQQTGIYAERVDDESIKKLCDSAPLHDIGKVKIPDAILNKPGRLTAEEFEQMKTHTTEGANILRSSLSDIEDDSWLCMAVDMAQYHHERWDGAGYPEGLSGEQIPLCARIMAVSDVFDALVSERSYKKAFSFEKAMQILREGAGTQFDAQIVDAFLGAEDEVRQIMDER